MKNTYQFDTILVSGAENNILRKINGGLAS